MPKLSRRGFLKLSGGTAAAGTTSLLLGGTAVAAQPLNSGRVTLDYPRKEITKASALQPGDTLTFNYPDDTSPCTLIRLDQAVADGAGADADIVAYSKLCSHMGCLVEYEAERGVLKCACHYSLFDPGKHGQQVCGQSTVNLPRITLLHDSSTDMLTAVGVDGLIYGRQANIL
ncbi:MAG: arsenate reductase (azurin) small subunit [Ectothiorhodospira sp.]